ncbi:hypothetical protein LZ31DRAFT_557396 [Colletotrichum somersetense]|nr:hypothetical protein LZ31DRAFT_557396 [Colletotrichum somersetense]
MPFHFDEYEEKCNSLTPAELQREWEKYTRLISSASTSTALNGMALPFTLGISIIGIGLAAGADAIAIAGVEHGVSAITENEIATKAVTHATLDGLGLSVEHAHEDHLKKQNAGVGHGGRK